MNAPLPPGAASVAELFVSEIVASPNNPRKHFDDAYIAEMAESIKNIGLIQPITVRPNPNPKTRGGFPYELVVGECRWRAAKLAGLSKIPGFWRELDNKQVLEIQIIENLQRRDVHELEEANGYRVLMDRHGYQVEQIAAKIGKSKAYVYARLKLTALCEAAQEAFYAKKLDASTALLVARIRGETLQKKAVKALTTEGYGGGPKSYRDAKYYIQNQFTISLKQATFSPDDAHLVPDAGACSSCPLRSGNDPELFADIVDADICTDTKCFEAKRQARQAALLANAEQLKIPVLQGDAAKAVGNYSFHSIDRQQYIPLDDKVNDDPEGRTYRQILGEQAPIAALIEVGWSESDKTLVEVAEPTALAAALKNAGIEVADSEAKGGKEPDANRQQRLEQERQAAARDAEIERRTKMRDELLPKLAELAIENESLHRLLQILAAGFLERETELAGEVKPEILGRCELVASTATATIDTWPTSKLLTFLFEFIVYDELRPGYDLQEESKPLTLTALSEFFLLSPTPAAQAREVGAKTAAPAKAKKTTKAAPAKTKTKSKTKALTAPASPANEPAAPVKTELKLIPAQAWPFPTGSRP